MCGGTGSQFPPLFLIQGLSPRVRGNHSTSGPQRRRRGSIPACAGEPPSESVTFNQGVVYPRVCGGTRIGTPLHDHVRGLSPRVRGNRFQQRHHRSTRGSIPACAGEPGGGGGGGRDKGVYPRVCGGTRLSPASTAGGPGLSPRVRGNRSSRGKRKGSAGSIPACAGEPLVVKLLILLPLQINRHRARLPA